MLLVSTAQAQHWVYDINGTSNDQVADVKTDGNGDIFITGEFSGAIVFDGQSFLSNGGIDFFLAKLDSTGALLWWAQGGGPGIDRGIKLCVGGNGMVAVVGEFMGTATFGGTTLISQGGSQDLFLALFDAATGTMQWIDDGGGTLAGDRPYGVTIAPSGNVTMAGEFRGTSAIGSATLTSMLDPNTMLPSVDVFIVSYSPVGVPLWTKQGAAEFTDRSIDAVSDSLGNIYVCGQFSDTIAFDNTYLNAMYNATFIIKYDAAGNELWFRRCGGAIYDHVRDMQWTSTGELLLTGDLQGTMIYLDSVPDFIASTDPYSYYLMRVSPTGEFLHAALTGSDNYLTARALEERGDTVLVLGQFECQWTQPIDSTSTGIFMATGTQDLFTAVHALDSLHLLQAQQYGGQQEKLAGGIASLPSGEAIFSGSYEDILVFPAKGVWEADLLYMSGGTSNYCGDQDYGYFVADTSNGLKDGFIAKGWVRDRLPYDFWQRDDALCLRDRKPLCIEANGFGGCPDSVAGCGPRLLHVDPHMAWTAGYWDHFIAYDLQFQWSTGSDSTVISATTTGWYWVNVESTNGCWQYNDSIYVVVNPFPGTPLISDDWVVNTNAVNPDGIVLCDPDSVWIWCPNPYPNATLAWTNDIDTIVVYNDSILVDTTGVYYLVVTTDSGCMGYNDVPVLDMPSPSLVGITADILLFYPQDTDLNDTVVLCSNQDLSIGYTPTWYLNGLPYALPAGMGVRYRFIPPGGAYYSLTNGGTHYGSQTIFVEGWYYHTLYLLLLNQPCGDDTLFFSAIDSIYVDLLPAIPVNVALSGPATICPGDTAMLVAICDTCTYFSWSGPGIVINLGDTVYTTSGGIFWVTATLVDSTGCSHASSDSLTIAFPPYPELDVFPSDGIICPDSFAIIFTDAVGQHSWYGPNGLEASTNDSIWVTTVGDYYLQTIDAMGCVLDSDPILVTAYATPFLNVLPDGVLCVNDGPVILQVVSTNYTSLVWDAPLSGNAPLQTVTLPGTYSVSVTACGIVTTLQAVVIQGAAVADLLTPGPYTICPGDTVLLEAAPGQALYFWQPGQQFGSTFAATAEGAYQVVVIDPNGCSDTSAVVTVDVIDFSLPLMATGASVCLGDTAQLTATGSGVITWYSDAALMDSVFSGSTWTLLNVQADTAFYITQSENGCTSPVAIAAVSVVQPLSAPVISGPDSVCAGSPITLLASGAIGAQFNWTTPNGPFTGAAYSIASAQSGDAGLYTCYQSLGACTGPVASFILTVLQPALLDLGPDLSICPGDTATILLPAAFSNPLWSNGAVGNPVQVVSSGQITVDALDGNGCTVSDAVVVTVIAPSEPLTAQDISICLGADATLVAQGSGIVTWTSDAAGTINIGTGNTLVLVQPQGTITVFVWQADNGCTWGPLPVTAVVNIPPENVVAEGPEFACEGQDVTISINATPGTTVQWSTPAGTLYGDPIQVNNVQQSDSGLYVASTFANGCAGDTGSWWLVVYEPADLDIGPDTTFCSGGTFTLSMPNNFSDPLWSNGSTNTSITVGAQGYYTLEATDANGCLVNDGVFLTAVECIDVLPNVITPNGDGNNDTWLLGGGFTGALLIVFDRFGDKVYEDDPRVQPFNGIHQFSRVELSEGVYFYVLTIERFGGVFDERKGYVQLVR